MGGKSSKERSSHEFASVCCVSGAESAPDAGAGAEEALPRADVVDSSSASAAPPAPAARPSPVAERTGATPVATRHASSSSPSPSRAKLAKRRASSSARAAPAATSAAREAAAAVAEEEEDREQADSDGRSLLWRSAALGHAAECERLCKEFASVSRPDRDGVTPLFVAAQEGFVRVVEILLAHGAAVDQAEKTGATPLLIAAQEGHTEIALRLLEAGADINAADSRGATALLMAMHRGHAELARQLVQRGANCNCRHATGATPLYTAAQSGHDHLCQLLVDKGADPDATARDGSTPLHAGVAFGHMRVCQILVAAGADIERRSDAGDTPLLLAVRHGRVDVVHLLLAAGTSIGTRDGQGRHAMQLAEESKNSEMADVIRRTLLLRQRRNSRANTPRAHAESGAMTARYLSGPGLSSEAAAPLTARSSASTLAEVLASPRSARTRRATADALDELSGAVQPRWHATRQRRMSEGGSMLTARTLSAADETDGAGDAAPLTARSIASSSATTNKESSRESQPHGASDDNAAINFHLRVSPPNTARGTRPPHAGAPAADELVAERHSSSNGSGAVGDAPPPLAPTSLLGNDSSYGSASDREHSPRASARSGTGAAAGHATSSGTGAALPPRASTPAMRASSPMRAGRAASPAVNPLLASPSRTPSPAALGLAARSRTSLSSSPDSAGSSATAISMHAAASAVAAPGSALESVPHERSYVVASPVGSGYERWRSVSAASGASSSDAAAAPHRQQAETPPAQLQALPRRSDSSSSESRADEPRYETRSLDDAYQVVSMASPKTAKKTTKKKSASATKKKAAKASPGLERYDDAGDDSASAYSYGSPVPHAGAAAAKYSVVDSPKTPRSIASSPVRTVKRTSSIGSGSSALAAAPRQVVASSSRPVVPKLRMPTSAPRSPQLAPFAGGSLGGTPERRRVRDYACGSTTETF